MPYKDKNKQKEAQRKHYLSNKDKYKKSHCNNLAKRRKWFRGLKSKQKCYRCGECNWYCLDFHHRDSESKLFGISYAVKYGYSKKRILVEIAKCHVLCANCHVREHYNTKRFHSTNQLWLREFKKTLKCNGCGIADHIVLAFHHIGSKTDKVSSMASKSYTVIRLLEEIAQCEVLCCNCHRLLHEGNIWDKASTKKREY
jgi:Pyruvate/2-oxoacid:ferredoxin oxidoreductase delta subunit